jgi:hypothetical protein
MLGTPARSPRTRAQVRAIAAMVAHQLGVESHGTALAATIFFWSRAAHALMLIPWWLLFAKPIAPARTLLMAAGWMINLIVAEHRARPVEAGSPATPLT